MLNELFVALELALELQCTWAVKLQRHHINASTFDVNNVGIDLMFSFEQY
jgi:hypothetical protein